MHRLTLLLITVSISSICLAAHPLKENKNEWPTYLLGIMTFKLDANQTLYRYIHLIPGSYWLLMSNKIAAHTFCHVTLIAKTLQKSKNHFYRLHVCRDSLFKCSATWLDGKQDFGSRIFICIKGIQRLLHAEHGIILFGWNTSWYCHWNITESSSAVPAVLLAKLPILWI